MHLDEILQNVNSKETFFEFIKALMEDEIDENIKEKSSIPCEFSDGKNGWVNSSISQFLESIHAFGSENDNIKLEWKSIAFLFYAGKFYE